MKIYVLFEKKSFADGDMVVAVSTSERKIKKELGKKIEAIKDLGFKEDYRDDSMFLSYDDSGDCYEISIKVYETLK